MNTFIKNNWFKLIISIAFLIIALSAGYYFVIFMPEKTKITVQQQAQEKYLVQQEKCKEAGLKAFQQDSLIYDANNMLEPSYTYNENLNLCLYSGGYRDDDIYSGQCGDIIKHYCDSYWERWVKNSFTNEKIKAIVNYTNKNGEWTADSDDINQFWKDHDKLMSSD